MKTNPRDIRKTNRWKKKSEQMRRNSPLCADPFGYHGATGRHALAVDVHHKDEVANAPGKAFDEDNLLCVCKLCHKALHGAIDARLEIDAGLESAGRPAAASRGKGGKKLSLFHSRPNAVARRKIHGIFTGGGMKIKDGVLKL